MTERYTCEDCRGVWDLQDLAPPPDPPAPEDRVPGRRLPSGLCPMCGAVCHITEDQGDYARFDFVLVGDGSGVNKAGGWALIIHDTALRRQYLLAGAVSQATNNIMELECYTVGLGWLKRAGARSGASVLICSDSEFVVKCGNGTWRKIANAEWWAAFDSVSNWFNVSFLHLERNSTPAAKFVDDLGRRARILLEKLLDEEFGRLPVSSDEFPVDSHPDGW